MIFQPDVKRRTWFSHRFHYHLLFSFDHNYFWKHTLIIIQNDKLILWNNNYKNKAIFQEKKVAVKPDFVSFWVNFVLTLKYLSLDEKIYMNIKLVGSNILIYMFEFKKKLGIITKCNKF